jgi:hypothetical protein
MSIATNFTCLADLEQDAEYRHYNSEAKYHLKCYLQACEDVDYHWKRYREHKNALNNITDNIKFEAVHV